jgi:hypothetical protein
VNIKNWSAQKMMAYIAINELSTLGAILATASLVPQKVYAGTGHWGLASFLLAINVGLFMGLNAAKRRAKIMADMLDQGNKALAECLAEDERRKEAFIKLNREAISMWKSRGELAMAASHEKLLKSMGYPQSSKEAN